MPARIRKAGAQRWVIQRVKNRVGVVTARLAGCCWAPQKNSRA
jgi:hypothetical protein